LTTSIGSLTTLEGPMTETCPIALEVIDDHATRIGAAIVILATLAGLWFGSSWAFLALAVDFGLRNRGWVKVSPIAQLASFLRTALRIQPAPVDAGPKRFAAGIGALFSLGLALALWRHQPEIALGLAGLLVLAAALEALFGYCVGCKIYGLLTSLRRQKEAPDAGLP
jgi:hypothetical protein